MTTPQVARNFSSRPSGFDDVDVIVIGSGMSGLATAALLGAYGKKVVVLEQHDTPGGSMHHFKQGTEWVSAGWHYVGRPGASKPIWQYITNGQEYTSERDEVFDTYWAEDGSVIPMTGSNVSDVMGIKFADMGRCASYFSTVVAVKILPFPIAALTWLWFRLSGGHKEAFMNYGEWCKKVTGEKKEKPVWWCQQGDHGTPKDRTCAMLGATLPFHYRNGAIHPEGGVRETVMRMCKRIVDNKGAVLLKAPVSSIVVEGNAVRGVEVEGVRVNAKQVIVSTGVEPLSRILKDKMPKNLLAAMKVCGNSAQHGAVFLTYTGKTRKDLGVPVGNHWVDHDEVKLFLSTKESETGCICYILWEMPYIPRGPEYEEKKEEFAAKHFEWAVKAFPQLKFHDEYDSATPATTEFYINSWAGSSYGLGMPTERYSQWSTVRALAPATSIKGLYLTGQDLICAGIASALASAHITVQAIRYPGWSTIFGGDVLKDVKKFLKKQ